MCLLFYIYNYICNALILMELSHSMDIRSRQWSKLTAMYDQTLISVIFDVFVVVKVLYYDVLHA